jgi:hypothetical protein
MFGFNTRARTPPISPRPVVVADGAVQELELTGPAGACERFDAQPPSGRLGIPFSYPRRVSANPPMVSSAAERVHTVQWEKVIACTRTT